MYSPPAPFSGDVFQLGPNVLLEVSQPRAPCYNLVKRFGTLSALPGGTISKVVEDWGAAGWLYRVIQPGTASSGDDLVLVRRPFPRLTVRAVHSIMRDADVDPSLIAEIRSNRVLDNFWRSAAVKKVPGVSLSASQQERLLGPEAEAPPAAAAAGSGGGGGGGGLLAHLSQPTVALVWLVCAVAIVILVWF